MKLPSTWACKTSNSTGGVSLFRADSVLSPPCGPTDSAVGTPFPARATGAARGPRDRPGPRGAPRGATAPRRRWMPWMGEDAGSRGRTGRGRVWRLGRGSLARRGNVRRKRRRPKSGEQPYWRCEETVLRGLRGMRRIIRNPCQSNKDGALSAVISGKGYIYIGTLDYAIYFLYFGFTCVDPDSRPRCCC